MGGIEPEARILVLGASGFLGPHLVAALAPSGRVLAASRRPEAAPAVGGLRPAATRTWDALAPDAALEELLDGTRPDVVLLATALARVADCERDPDRARRLNVDLPARLARACRKRGLRVLLVSTDLVFGGRSPAGGQRYAEQDPPSTWHVYGRTKAAGEVRFLEENPAGLVGRLALLFGDSCGRGLGAGDQVLAALERGERPPLFEDEWRTPLEVGNAARALAELALGQHSGILHLAGPERVSRLELGLLVLEARGLTRAAALQRVRPARRADLGQEGRPEDVSLDASRARGILGTALLAPREALGLAPA